MSEPGDRGKPVGIDDVARAAGVSITTVSHALSGRGQVAAGTASRVRDAAEALGYKPNRLASALRSRKSRILGLVSDDIATTPFATRVVLGAQDAAAENDQLLLVINSNNHPDVESRQISALVAAQVDALVYARMFHQTSSMLPAELDRTPSVLLDASDSRGRLPSAVPDEKQIGRLATETLIRAGHTHIAHLTVDASGRGSDGRRSGYLAAMRAAGLTSHIFEGEDPGTASAGRSAFARMLAARVDVTAVVCFNDPMAMGVYQAAASAGLSIPGDLSVVGVDNFEPVATALLPALTTIALPHYEMGRWGVEHALRLLENPQLPIERLLLSGQLVLRDSVAAPRR